MSALTQLQTHKELSRRRLESDKNLARIRAAFLSEKILDLPATTFFCAGSLGRLEAGGNSDLDIFVLSGEPPMSRLQEVRVLSKIADINDELGFPPFSDAMRYMKVYNSRKLIDDTGKPRDDSENSFTTRMLLLLESAPLRNEALYGSIAKSVCENYFRDNKGRRDFKPLFLINDLLRYWRTLCLNYEQCRDDPSKPWRKRNVNLRFSRLTTVFSTVALLMIDNPQTAEELTIRIQVTPLERLARSVDSLGEKPFVDEFEKFLDHYATFLRVKDNPKPDRLLQMRDTKQKIRASSEYVADYFHRIFCSKSLKEHYRYLMISV